MNITESLVKDRRVEGKTREDEREAECILAERMMTLHFYKQCRVGVVDYFSYAHVSLGRK